jgi:hypothetical protein
MAANTAPIFPKVGSISWGTLQTANTAKDGTGTVVTVFTADATNGSRLDTIKCRATGTNTASVLRIFINNGSTNTVAANNTLYMERSLPATTLSEVAELVDIEIPINLVLPASYKANVTIGTTVAATWHVTGVGGIY